MNNLINRFSSSLDYYKNPRNNYNEHSCRIEYIDPLLKLLGWDVANERGSIYIQEMLKRHQRRVKGAVDIEKMKLEHIGPSI